MCIYKKSHSQSVQPNTTTEIGTTLTLSGPGFFWVPQAWGGGGGGGGVPAAHNSKTIRGIEMKFGRIVENYKLINLV